MQPNQSTGFGEGEEEEQNVRPEDIDEVVEIEDGDEPMDEDDDDGNDDAGGEEEDEVGGLPSENPGQSSTDDQGMHTLEDTSIAAFYEHRKSVFAVELHPHFPNPPIAVSGGEDDAGYIWSTHDGTPLVKLGGHEDSVIAVGFSFAGDFVATGGMDGRVRVWRRRPSDENDWKTWEFIASLEGPDEVVWIDWHPRGNVIAAGGADSTVWMWTLPGGKAMQVFAGHAAAVTSGAFTPDGKKLVTASEDGSLIVWDPRSPQPVAKLQSTDARFNLVGGITKLRISPDSKTVVVGGADGDVRIVSIARVDDEGAISVVAALNGHNEGESIEAIEFIDLFGVLPPPTIISNNAQAQQAAAQSIKPVTTVFTGATDGKGMVWDISNGKMRNAISHEAAITNVVVHQGTTFFSTSSADHTIKTWDARTGACIATHTGFTDGVLALAAGKDDGFTQGAETGGIGAYAQPGSARGFKLVGAGDEGIALVFRV